MCVREYVGTCECVWKSLFLCEGVFVGMLGFGPCEFLSGEAEGQAELWVGRGESERLCRTLGRVAESPALSGT